ncbi:MAG: DUF368 domain-containing protein [Armatimonadetes bacterium]|nr:MAG: DUF368 domain-containing protein [Armatimonadota bacterium]
MILDSITSFVRGFAMGTADLVPGVSGGTIALVFGIYEKLVASIRAGSSALGSLVRADVTGFRRWMGEVEWRFIIPLGMGILFAVVSLAQVISDLLHNEPVLMASLFVGLVAGSMVVAWNMIRRPEAAHLWIALAVGVVVFFLLGLRSGTTEDTVQQVTDPAMWAYFGAGAIAICAMILPGISGSFILIMLGMYTPVLGAVTDRNVGVVLIFMVGAVVGLALFSQLLHRALTTRHDVVLAALVGLMGGSLRVLWPWPLGVDSTKLGSPDSDVALALVMAVIGFGFVLVIARFAAQIEESNAPSTD